MNGCKVKLTYNFAQGGLGFDPKIMRKAISLRRVDTEKRQEESDLLDIYMHALEGAADNVSPQETTKATLEVVGE